jgi:hypothetical protein
MNYLTPFFSFSPRYFDTVTFSSDEGGGLKNVAEACSSVSYLPVSVMSVLWRVVSALHGRRSTTSPSWLLLNKPQLFHNMAWWSARCPSVPAHIHSPLVTVAWKRSVARWKAMRELERARETEEEGMGGVLPLPPSLVKLGKKGSASSYGSGGSGGGGGGGWMKVEELFEEEGGGGGEFARCASEALSLLRQANSGSVGGGEDEDVVGNVVAILDKAVRSVVVQGASGGGKEGGRREEVMRNRMIYCVLLQLSAHHGIGFLSSLLSLDDDLNQSPLLESVLVGGSKARFKEVVATTDATAMRSVFGHLY